MGEVIFMPPNEKLRYDANACAKSATRSLGSSTPTHTRTMSSGKSRDARTSAGIDARVTEDSMAYFLYSRGFKSGGWNGRAAAAAALGPYDPEFVDAFELGYIDGAERQRLREINRAGNDAKHDNLAWDADWTWA